ncbi:MAG: RelA/SpoT family protein [Dysgonamonadaceae bacterium]|jgi:GTP pyrophosphokinase|nr:RelA/SpoT family protein [Dysgonamonadaceae bacterium]
MDARIPDTTGEEKMVQTAFERLIESYSRSNHRQKFEIIDKAFLFANQAHKGVKRRSGEPYIMHPLAVALIVSEEMGLGSTSICSALLHDVVEDTDYTVEDIRNLFGDKIAQIVGGLTKISGGIFAEAASAQAENMRKLLLTMSDDIRVILIKIADRLHNMRTLGALLPAKQYKIAGETMYLYAPMAHRLGLFAIKSELEDLSFKYEHPEEYRQIEQKLAASAKNQEEIYGHFAAPLHPKLDELGIRYRMQKRVKSIYSIWNKMQVKKVEFEDIYDIFAVRIVFEPKSNVDVKKQCWDIYSAVTDLYKLRPDRIRDWVSRPKANGYQALHLTAMGPDGQWIEIQIRSAKMDEIAEKGFAAHWKYKEHGNVAQIEEETELDRWLERIQDILEAPSPNAMDFLDTIKLNLYASEIFVFTPKGEIKTLPQGATALDFGYEIHTNVGDHCIGAKVNHRLVPMSHQLNSGDQVEILTSRSQSPFPEWLGFVTTAKAKTKIESSLKKRKKEKIKEGEQILDDIFLKADVEISIQIIDKLLASYGYPKKEDLYFSLAEKQVDLLPENLKKILKEKSSNYLMKLMKQAFNVGLVTKENTDNRPTANTTGVREIDRGKTYVLEEENFQKNYIAASCCNPLPGDDVVGFVRDDNRLEIHKHSCSVALTLKTRFGDRIISCEWAGHKAFSFPRSIEVEGIDRIGILSEIARAIADDLSVNVKKLTLASGDGVFGGTIEVTICDTDDINTLINRLQKIKGVKSVKRTD